MGQRFSVPPGREVGVSSLREQMRLFDNFERDDCSPIRHPEGILDFLNRSGWVRSRRIREVIESWFAQYPVEHKQELGRRLRSKNSVPFHTAIFELALHELLRKEGRTTVHPEADWGTSSRVDFRVEPDGGQAYLVEAVTLCGESQTEHKAEGVLQTLCEAVNEVESPDYFLHLSVDGAAKQQPSSRKLKRFLREKLRSVKPDELASENAGQGLLDENKWVYSENGLVLTFTRTPKSPALRGKPGVRPLGVRVGAFKWSTVVPDLREQLRRKAKNYGTPPLPLVIAVNVLDWTYSGHQELEQALFGTLRETVPGSRSSQDRGTPNVVESRIVQKQDGLWFDGQTPHYRVVAGVLGFHGLSASSLGVVKARLFLNPFANFPLTSGFHDYPTTRMKDGELVHENGKSVAEMFGLPGGWPGTEAEN